MDTNVRLQNLRDFTVQIRRLSDDKIVGTGIVVSVDGKVVTCAHVVEMAGVDPKVPDGEEIGVYFPQVRDVEEKKRRATVSACFHQHDDDVVVLQLLDGPAPLGPEQIAVLGTADFSQGNSFRSYGYRRLDDYTAGWADGRIQGYVDFPEGRNLQAEPLQLESSQINRGMSGAAILDVERNLVVGLVSETWFAPEGSLKDRDTAWAVSAHVLGFDPLNLTVRDTPLPKRASIQPKVGVEIARRVLAPRERIVWNNAPPPLEEWVGREDLLQALSSDWADTNRTVTGLIGFGGEGKSSLARRWVDELLADTSQPQPDGIFWWGFYTKPSVDEFFEVALNFLCGGSVDPQQYPSSSAKAHLIAAMLHTGRYLFVLDGLEILQYQESDKYGLLRSIDLREFLRYFATPGHQSFCLITSRVPVLDLMDFTTYHHQDMTGLSTTDGLALLRELGVKGGETALVKIITDWDGHALTLSLLAGYLTEQYEGDVTRMPAIPLPTASEPRYERVHRLLRRYEAHLTEAEGTFLILFSAFRTPVGPSAFKTVFRTPIGGRGETVPLNAAIIPLNDVQFDALVSRLQDYRLIRYDQQQQQYTMHPLVRAHFLALLAAGDNAQAQDAHQRLKDYYLFLAGEISYSSTLDNLNPLIEVVHHACLAGAYDEAVWIYEVSVQGHKRFVLTFELGAYETALALLQDFFPDGDIRTTPRVKDPKMQAYLLNEVGLCLTSLGRLQDALHVYERSKAIVSLEKDLVSASITCQNLAEAHAYLGQLGASVDTARQALAYAREANDMRQECDSLAYVARAAYLLGDTNEAGTLFAQAEELQGILEPDRPYLYGLRGLWHAEYLWRTGDSGRAENITERNLTICEDMGWQEKISQCHRLLTDMYASVAEHEQASIHYHQAVEIAQLVSHRPVMIEALLGRGRWVARYKPLTGVEASGGSIFGDLDEALSYAREGDYRIHEADIRVAMAWVHLINGDSSTAQAEAERARQMSKQMGYYWGQVDANEVLAELDKREESSDE